MTITRNDRKAQLELIWNALQFYREEGIPDYENDSEECKQYNEEWDELCTVMAWIEEDLNLVNEVDDLIEKVK